MALAALCAFVFYLPSLPASFQFDDFNVIVLARDAHTWAWLIDGPVGIRPLLRASYTFNWMLDPAAPGFHLFNILIHALNAALVFAIGRRLAEGWLGAGHPWPLPAALAAALLFALHPVQTEAVTYVTGRSSSLSAAFYMGALLAYLRGGRGWSCALFACAIAAKETAITLPLALLMIERVAARPASWREVRRRQWPYWALLAAALAAMAAHPQYRRLLEISLEQRTTWENLTVQVSGLSYLVSRLFLVHRLNIDPALPAFAQWDLTLAAEGALLLAMLGIAVWSLRSRPWIAFGLLWFYLQLAPTNSLLPRIDVANERQLYLASWGLFLALSVQIARLEPARVAWATGVMLLAAALGGWSVARQLDYRSEVRLWEASVRESPWNERAHNNLGYAYRLEGRIADARREFETALVLRPGYYRAVANLAVLPPDHTPR
jgi:tetratricopeptide (TPR) repeat protein